MDDAEEDAALGRHSQVRAIVVAGYWVPEASLLEGFEEVGEGANLIYGEGFGREEAEDDEDDERVEVVCQKSCFDPSDEGVQSDADGEEEGCGDYVHAGPVICQHQKERRRRIWWSTTNMAVMTADAPRSMFAHAKRLFRRHSTMYTMCATFPAIVSKPWLWRILIVKDSP